MAITMLRYMIGLAILPMLLLDGNGWPERQPLLSPVAASVPVNSLDTNADPDSLASEFRLVP